MQRCFTNAVNRFLPRRSYSLNSIPYRFNSRSCDKIRLPYFAEETGVDHDLIRQQFMKYDDDNYAGFLKMKSFGRDVICPLRGDTIAAIKHIEAKGYAVSDWPQSVLLALGEHSMVFLNGEKHKRIRKCFQPFFLETALRERYNMLSQVTNEYVETLCSETGNNPNEYISNFPIAKQWAWNIAIKIIFGEHFMDKDFSSQLLSTYMVWALGMMDIDGSNADKPGTLLGDAMVKRKELLFHLDSLKNDAFVAYSKGELDKTCVMYKVFETDMLSQLSNEEFLDQILVLINASHDTTAATCNNVIFALYSFPEIAMRVKTECMKLRKVNGEFDYDELDGCEYLEAFVQEVLRWVPTVPFTSKRLVKNERINDCPLDKDSIICLSNVGMSRSANQFENAYEFNPNRFIHKNVNKYEGWLPFGKGTKKCLGSKLAVLELKLVSAVLSTQCRFEIDDCQVQVGQNFFLFYEMFGKFYKI